MSKIWSNLAEAIYTVVEVGAPRQVATVNGSFTSIDMVLQTQDGGQYCVELTGKWVKAHPQAGGVIVATIAHSLRDCKGRYINDFKMVDMRPAKPQLGEYPHPMADGRGIPYGQPMTMPYCVTQTQFPVQNPNGGDKLPW